MNFRNILIGLIVSAGLAGGVVSCGGGGGGSTAAPAAPAAPATPATIVRSASLTGAQEVPPVVSGATGRGAVVVVNPTTMEITGGVTFTGLVPTDAHIHRADTSIAVGLVLAADNATAVLPPNTMLLAADYAELLAGTLYFNVHTVANPNGEIRGQINVQGGVIAGVASMNGGLEVPPVTTTATGKGTVVVNQASPNTILIAYITHTVANADMAHIHTSPSGPGSNGGIIVGFSNLQTNFGGSGTNLAYPPAGSLMSATDITNFLANYLYFNVHSTANGNPAGEIRGNITAIQ